MELLPLLCLCVLTRSGTTSADQHGPETITVTEGSDVTLPCSTSEDLGFLRFVWNKDGQKEVFVYDAGSDSSKGLSGQHEQFKGRVSYFSGELRNGKASITIRDTKVTDSGDYTCEIRHLNPPNQKFHIKLLVDGPLKDRSGENIPGAVQKSCVTILKQTQDWALLQCEVRGASPKPKVQWQDRAGNNLPAKEPQVSERGGRYDVILQTTVTETDHYRCVATQEEINHQIDSQIHVYISGIQTGWIVAGVLGVLVFVLLLVVVFLKKKLQHRSNADMI